MIQRDYTKSMYDYYYTDIGVDDEPANREKTYTSTGREVYGGGGITPDVRVDLADAIAVHGPVEQRVRILQFCEEVYVFRRTEGSSE